VDGGSKREQRAVEPLTLFLGTVLDFLYFTKNAKISKKLALKTIFVLMHACSVHDFGPACLP